MGDHGGVDPVNLVKNNNNFVDDEGGLVLDAFEKRKQDLGDFGTNHFELKA